MGSPPFRPKTAIPSHVTNVPSPLSISTEARDKKERDNLKAAIQASERGRQIVDFDRPLGNGHLPSNIHSDTEHSSQKIVHTEVDVGDWHDGAPTPLATSRAQSPYTQHPTVDFVFTYNN